MKLGVEIKLYRGEYFFEKTPIRNKFNNGNPSLNVNDGDIDDDDDGDDDDDHDDDDDVLLPVRRKANGNSFLP